MSQQASGAEIRPNAANFVAFAFDAQRVQPVARWKALR